ncbi:hypothetical protein JW859_09130, partial [bacterium]|nr:hypothetical protein [bacterium]
DGQIYQYDITPIGVHWQERLSGYRVYRKGPADLGFRFLTGSGEEQLSAGRPAVDNTAPVRYAFSDDNEGGGSMAEGIYAYYIAPYDTASGKEGPASAIYVVSTTGVEPQAPVAALTVSPEFAGAPAEITLDATASYDPDGTIAAYHWDFDADGVVDWISTDAVPETSSAGTVDAITPGADGVVTVSYNHGSADWYFPSVVTEDDLGLTSLPAFAQLGISGWIGEVVGDEHGTADVMIDMIAISEDPLTGEALAFGKSEGGNEYPPHPWVDILPAGFYVARRHGPGDWEHELVALEDTAAWHNYYEKYEWVNLDWAEFFWQENGEPGVVMHTYPTSPNFDGRLYVALRQADGTWEVSCIYEGQLPLNYSKRGVYDQEIEILGPEKFAILFDEFVETTSSQSVFHSYVLTYDQGTIILDDTGAEHTGPVPASTHWMLADIAVDSNGEMVCLLDKSFQIYPNELWVLRRLGPDNWVDERLDNGNLEPADGTFMFRYCFYDENDRLLILAHVGDYAGEVRTADYRLYSWNGSQVSVESTCDVLDMNGCLYKLGEDGSCAYYSMDPGNPLQYVKLEEDCLIIENLPTESSYFVCHGVVNIYNAYAEVEYDTYPGPGIELANEFVFRVDPRE